MVGETKIKYKVQIWLDLPSPWMERIFQNQKDALKFYETRNGYINDSAVVKRKMIRIQETVLREEIESASELKKKKTKGLMT